MSTTGTSRPTPSLRERRMTVMRRYGMSDTSRLELDKPPPSWFWIMIITAGLVMIGLTMVFSSSSVNNLHSGSSAYSMFWKQMLWVGAGVGAGWFLYKIPYQEWAKRNSWLIAACVITFGANVLVFLKGQFINGASAWLDVGPFRFQPSEFMKIVTILLCAKFLSARHRYVEISSVVLYPMLFVLGVTAGLCAVQRDYGSALIFGGIVLSMLFMASLPLRHLFMTTIGSIFLGALVMMKASRARDRLFAYLNLEQNKDTTGYQVYQALLSIANGGLKGTGIGAGTSKWGYVPLSYSDFIFSVIAEELGIFGSTIVIGGFVLLLLFGIQVALTSPDMNGAFIAGGVTAWLSFQAFVNIGGVIGMIPMTGLTLPFISYGGSSMIASLCGIALLLNVARYAKK